MKITPLERLLQSHPDRAFVHYLLMGFKFGFKLGFQGPQGARESRNLTSALSRPEVIAAHISKEYAAGNTVGPFKCKPIPDFVVSPLGVVPKKGDKWRLIMHLSFPDGTSINDGINNDDFPLKYVTVYHAMDAVMRLGPNTLMAKLDIKSAFRLCPVHPEDHHLLGFQWDGEFYYDRVLPFGLSSAPYIFDCLAHAIEWIAKHQGVATILHYLDDFFLVGKPDSPECERSLHTLMHLCSDLGVPLAQDKVEGPTS